MKSLTEFESKRLLNEFGLVSCKESVAKVLKKPPLLPQKSDTQLC